MNNYYREFTDVQIKEQDVLSIKGFMAQHRDNQVLDYHGYLDIRKTFKTTLATNLRTFAKKIDLRLAGIYAFTAKAGSITSIHTDGDEEHGPLPWRLAFYVGGEPGILSWYGLDTECEFNDHVKAYVYGENLPCVYSKKMDMSAAFVRTDIPHRLDISNNKIDRLTITATFLPWISWEELNSRLDKINAGREI